MFSCLVKLSLSFSKYLGTPVPYYLHLKLSLWFSYVYSAVEIFVHMEESTLSDFIVSL